MYLSPPSGLRLVKVMHRGVPNKELIAFTVDEPVNMGQFGIMLGVVAGPALATPIKDNLFWFGDGMVKKGDWIFVYTCAGEPVTLPPDKDGTNTYVVHWGRPNTLFANSKIVPILIQVGGVQVGDTPVDQPQQPLLGLLEENKLLKRHDP